MPLKNWQIEVTLSHILTSPVTTLDEKIQLIIRLFKEQGDVNIDDETPTNNPQEEETN